MNREQRFWYFDELVTQGIAAKISFENVERYLANEATKQSLLVWSSISAFLAHTAAISKILFPSRDGGMERAAELLELLNQPQLAHLRDRSGRDNVEHMDERIDNWAARDANYVVSMVIPDRAGYEYLCTPDKAVRRVLIEEGLVYVSEDRRGRRVETHLRDLLQDAEMVRETSLQRMLEDPPYQFLFAAAIAEAR